MDQILWKLSYLEPRYTARGNFLKKFPREVYRGSKYDNFHKIWLFSENTVFDFFWIRSFWVHFAPGFFAYSLLMCVFF